MTTSVKTGRENQSFAHHKTVYFCDRVYKSNYQCWFTCKCNKRCGTFTYDQKYTGRNSYSPAILYYVLRVKCLDSGVNLVPA